MKLYEEIEKSFPALEKLFTPEELLKFKNTTIGSLWLYHFGLGSWIRNNLLSNESLLYRIFKNHTVESKDDMSAVMIRLFHYYLWNI